MTAVDSPAHDRSTVEAGAAPPSLGSRRIRASRASCIASGCIAFGVGCAGCAARSAVSLAAPSLASPRRPATSPSGTASRASPARSRCRNGWPAAPGAPGCPVQDGAGEGVTGQRAQVRDTGDDRQVSRPAEDTGGVNNRIGQAQMRGGHRGQGMITGQHPARRRRPPGRRGCHQQPIAISRSSAAAVSAGSTPVAAKRSRTASHGSSVRSRCHTRWLRTPAPRSSSGRSVSTTSHWSAYPLQQCLADGERRHAWHDPHRHVGMGERRRARPLRAGPHSEHPGPEVLAACLVQQRPQDGKRRPGCRHCHSCTRHSTTTCLSWCSSRNAASLLSTSSGRPPWPGSPGR